MLDNPKIVGRHRGNRTEIELHTFRAAGNGIPLNQIAGVELIIDQTPEVGRRKMTCAALHWEAVIDLHKQLGEIIAKGRMVGI